MTSAEGPGKSRHLTVALQLAAVAWLAMALQEILLFARPNPYGEPYVGLWKSYLPYALVYNLLGVMLASAPVVLYWLILDGRTRPSVAAGIHRFQLGVLILVVLLDQLDNEVMRFMGIHLTYGLVRTYYKVNAWGADMFYIILGDRGGPGVPFLILFGVSSALWWAGRRVIESKPFPLSRRLAVAAAAVPVLVPLLIQHYRYPGDNRRLRVRPEIMTLVTELGDDLAEGDRPPDFESLVRQYHARWFEQSGDRSWRFPDPERPLIREPLTPALPSGGRPWNVIFIQLETFRGWNTGFLRPDVKPSATPFLDRLAADAASAYWRRHASFGPPTVSGFMAAHCSVKPHSRDNITASFTYTALDCLPAVLRRHGYRAELFTGFDPDWDNQGIWMRRWYDAFHYYDDIKNLDRLVFRRAAQRIRELGRGPQPFMATVISIANHRPFRARRMGPGEERFDLDPDRPPNVAIRNTMRYTDDVVREFIDSLQGERWYAHTLIVITGDHGYDLGEHGTSGQATGWRESIWVPLVIHGAHPRLPRGGHDEPASLLDIAPTLADLLDIRDPNPWMGSSLAVRGHTGSPFAVRRGPAVFGEQGRYSMVVNPSNGKTGLYDAIEDPLQHENIAAEHPGVAAALRREADDERRLVDYLLEANGVWREPDGGVGAR